MDKTDRLGQPYYHYYPFDFYSFQFHINMIRFFNVPNHKLILNVGLPKMLLYFPIQYVRDCDGPKVVDFKVYKLDEECGQWELEKSLGD